MYIRVKENWRKYLKFGAGLTDGIDPLLCDLLTPGQVQVGQLPTQGVHSMIMAYNTGRDIQQGVHSMIMAYNTGRDIQQGGP